MSENTGDKVVVLTVKNERNSETRVFRLHKRRVTLGSATSSDVRLEDADVSPVHAILEMSGAEGKPVVYDLASETGVAVNGKPAVQATLTPADSVRIGPYSFNAVIQSLTEARQVVPRRVRESFGQTLFLSEKEDLAPLILADEKNMIEIFDHRPEAKQCLQVVMFFRDTILDVEHFVDRKRVLIGPGRKEDFNVPPLGDRGSFELVSQQGGQYTLNLHGAMKGVVSKDGMAIKVPELLKSSKSVGLGLKDFAKVAIGDVSFFLNFSPAPPRLKLPSMLKTDPLFAKVWSLSLAVTGLLVYAMSTIEVNPTIEIEQLPERVATIIYEPKFMPVEKAPVTEAAIPVAPLRPQPPKTVTVTPAQPKEPAPRDAMIGEKKEEQKKAAPPAPPKPKAKPGAAKFASGQEGAGAKAKGPEGTRGKPGAAKGPVPQTKAQRPGEGPKTGAATTGKGRSETQDLGVVDVFKASQGTLSKVFAGGKGASNAASQLEGYSGFTTEGAGGLGAAGTEKGGGGESMGLGGLAEKGPGGGRKGTGLGALGSGGNILGGKGRISIESGGGGEPIVMGAIDTDAIAREIAKHRDEIKYCYEKEINAENPDLAGRVGIRFVIGASGTVSTAGVSGTTLKNANAERCIVDVIRRIQFPQVRGGGIAEVTYPFLFKPATK
ncbi:MAG: AgmX/PglI C-terminal domain-containing protein [Deltaproteobacteria bacterium]|nr:AgmX/PglI C-terminal domain-containing protein [Deltaproteobacteria bacterium]